VSTRLRWCALAACALGFLAVRLFDDSALRAWAQSTEARKDYALIYGTVWGEGDRPVGGVPIQIRRASDKKPRWELVSDSHGEFAQRVPPGKQDYVVTANVKIPKGQPKPQVTVQVEDNERKDISLHVNQ